MGRFGAIPIAFEAKHCWKDVISLNRVEDNQRDFLRDWVKDPGAIGFVIVSFRYADYYLIPWAYWEAALQAQQSKKGGAVSFPPMNTPWQTTGKASIRKDELPDEWKIKLQGTAALDYFEPESGNALVRPVNAPNFNENEKVVKVIPPRYISALKRKCDDF